MCSNDRSVPNRTLAQDRHARIARRPVVFGTFRVFLRRSELEGLQRRVATRVTLEHRVRNTYELSIVPRDSSKTTLSKFNGIPRIEILSCVGSRRSTASIASALTPAFPHHVPKKTKQKGANKLKRKNEKNTLFLKLKKSLAKRGGGDECAGVQAARPSPRTRRRAWTARPSWRRTRTRRPPKNGLAEAPLRDHRRADS